MKRGSSIVKVVLVLTLVAALIAPAAHAGEACAAAHDVQPTRTFDVRVTTRDVEYRVGDVVKFRVFVTRQVDGIALGPAEGAHVTLAVALDGHYIWGGGLTDQTGKATFGVRLKKYLPSGSADVYGFADKLIADLPCGSQLEYEFGSVMYPNLLDITRQ